MHSIHLSSPSAKILIMLIRHNDSKTETHSALISRQDSRSNNLITKTKRTRALWSLSNL